MSDLLSGWNMLPSTSAACLRPTLAQTVQQQRGQMLGIVLGLAIVTVVLVYVYRRMNKK